MKHDKDWLKAYREQNNRWRRENPEAVRASWKKQKENNPEKWLFKQAKSRAKLKGHEFNLELQDIVIPEKCPIMGVKMEWIPYGFNPYSPSIDRIDSTKGYTKDNIQVISSIANRMKWNATREQLITFCKGVLALEKEDALVNQC